MLSRKISFLTKRSFLREKKKGEIKVELPVLLNGKTWKGIKNKKKINYTEN